MGKNRDFLLAAVVWSMVAGLAFGGSVVVHFPVAAGCTAGCEIAVNTMAGNRGR